MVTYIQNCYIYLGSKNIEYSLKYNAQYLVVSTEYSSVHNSIFSAEIMFMPFIKHVQKFRQHVWAGLCCSVRVQAAAEQGSIGSTVSSKNVKFIL
jgi:hypothetical protein